MMGGALAVIDLTAGFLLLGLKRAFLCCEKWGAGGESSAADGTGTGVVQLAPTPPVVDPIKKDLADP